MTQIALPVEEETKQRPRISKRKFVEKLCGFLFPLLFLLTYTAIMAGIFYAIEKDCKSDFHCPVTTITMRKISEQLPTTAKVPTAVSDRTIVEYSSNYQTTTPAVPPTSIRTVYTVNKSMVTEEAWSGMTYTVAFHFVFISITTIGYGDIYPCSTSGEILTIIFTIIGIPITLMALTRTGKMFSFGLHKVWLFLYKKVKKGPYSNKQKRYMDNESYAPILLGAMVTVLWMLLSAEYFYLTLFDDFNPDPDTPPFTFFLAFYFTMISFLTIGFGDYAPIKYDLIFVTILFLIIGLASVTMCIDLAQLEFDMFFEEVVDMIDDEYKVSLENGEKGMSTENKEGVKGLINSKASFSTKMMTSLMGKKTEQHLAQAYENRAKYASMSAQTVMIVVDQDIQAYIEEAKPDERVDFSCQCDIDEEDIPNVPKEVFVKQRKEWRI